MELSPDTLAMAIAALYRYRDDYFERQPEYKDATAAIADLETLQQAASAAVGEWTPVPDGMYGVNEELAVSGDIPAIFVNQELGDTHEKLPPNIRLCKRVAAPQPAAMPAAIPANVWDVLRAALHDYAHDLTSNHTYAAKHKDKISDLEDAYDWLKQRRPGQERDDA